MKSTLRTRDHSTRAIAPSLAPPLTQPDQPKDPKTDLRGGLRFTLSASRNSIRIECPHAISRPESQVIAFEPDPDTFRMLKKNVAQKFFTTIRREAH
jgi:hypothetical protein